MFLFKSGKDTDKYYYCQKPEHIISAENVEEVIPCLRKIEQLQAQGYMIAGWISYEASVAFDKRHKVKSDGSFPLIYMMAAKDTALTDLSTFEKAQETQRSEDVTPHIDREVYEKNCSKVLDYIKEGDIYQANYSFPCDIKLKDDPVKIFKSVEEEHPVPYSCYMDTGKWQIISQSPELFLERRGQKICSMPMKGTEKRGLTFQDDETLRKQLTEDTKSQAENVMIVDLMRNDLSRICELNTVKVPELFQATRYGSLHQLTSTVEGRLKEQTTLEEILTATFPPGSITGAPKIRAMEIINELENDGRKLYTGSAALFYPGGDFTMNVCIRTIICSSGKAQLGIGSGIVADSAQNLEWQECLLKSTFLNYRRNHKVIFETMLFENGKIYLLKKHLKRLLNSCHYFKVPVDIDKIRQDLDALEYSTATKIKLSVDRYGKHKIEAAILEYTGWGKNRVLIKISSEKIQPDDVYRYHKTDCRQMYDIEFYKARREGFDEVIFLNSENFVCEGAISNIFVKKNGTWLTPQLNGGLLPGTWREKMIEELGAQEDHISLDDIDDAEEIMIGNSVRKKAIVDKIVN